MSAPHLVLIDGSAFLHRAHHGLPRLLRAGDHFPIGAITGFCNMLWWQIYRAQHPEEEKPATHMAVIFDHKSPNFRHRLYPEYKSNRKPIDEDLRVQLPYFRTATTSFGIRAIEMEGHEADDIIATFVMKACRQGAEVTIFSSDKDLMQLIGPMVRMFDPLKRQFIGPFEVYEKFGVYPEKMVELQALVGDTSDNIPGVPGIGPKIAAELLERFGSLDELLIRVDEIKQEKRRNNLMACRETIPIARQLVSLDSDVPIEFDLKDFEVRPPRKFGILLFLKRMGIVTLHDTIMNWFARYG